MPMTQRRHGLILARLREREPHHESLANRLAVVDRSTPTYLHLASSHLVRGPAFGIPGAQGLGFGGVFVARGDVGSLPSSEVMCCDVWDTATRPYPLRTTGNPVGEATHVNDTEETRPHSG
jgi:hypothetical protein